MPKKESSESQDWWILGGIFCIGGISQLMQGNVRSGIELLGLGLVFIAVFNKDLRDQLTEIFLSRFKSGK